jgi:hypothetical protein
MIAAEMMAVRKEAQSHDFEFVIEQQRVNGNCRGSDFPKKFYSRGLETDFSVLNYFAVRRPFEGSDRVGKRRRISMLLNFRRMWL